MTATRKPLIIEVFANQAGTWTVNAGRQAKGGGWASAPASRFFATQAEAEAYAAEVAR